MFEILSDKLSIIFRGLDSRGRLTEKDIDEALRQVRLALLEADVNFRVVKEFIGKVREEVPPSLTSTRRRSRQRSSKANSSGTKWALSPGQRRNARDVLRWQTRGRCS